MSGAVIVPAVGVFATTIGALVFLVATGRPAPTDVRPLDTLEPLPPKPKPRSRKVADNALLQRAIEVTADLADRRGLLGSVERTMRSGDIPIRPAEAIFSYVVAVALLAPLPLLIWGPTAPLGILGTVSILFGPPVGLKKYVVRRRKRFELQLPDMLTGLASSLRAGRSLGQSLELLSFELPDPVGRELRKIVAELRLGWPLVDTLDEAADRIGSDDFEWAVMAMKIQAEVGGNLAELLDGVAETMRERTRFKGEVKALTAEGRASAMMLVVMPPALVGVMKAMNPSYVEPLFTTSTGKLIVGISVAMLVAGWFAMNKIVQVEV